MKLWYPYKQMNSEAFPVIKSGSGAEIYLEDGAKLIDGISSCWAVIHGYNHPKINFALIKQINKFAHMMAGGFTHSSAKSLAEELVNITPEGLNHVFFSDSGSIGVEVALKMALQFWKNMGYIHKDKIVSLKNGYHGGVFKAMEVSNDSDFTIAFDGVLHRGFFVNTPMGGYHADEAIVDEQLRNLECLFQNSGEYIACFIVEPILQCAGGMNIYSPLYLKGARILCTRYNVLLICDEVATGFGRTGKMFASEHAQISPDIMILGKALTAGYLGHAATLTNSEVFNSLLGDSYEKTLMHGPAFMGNPMACTVALTSIAIFKQENYQQKIDLINKTIALEFSKILSEKIKEKRILGAVGAIEMKDEESLVGFENFSIEQGAWLRPIGKVLYLMPPYIINNVDLIAVLRVMRKWINNEMDSEPLCLAP